MKKLIALGLAVFLSSANAYASTTNIPEGMAKKAIRGAINLVTGIVEVPMQTYKGYQKGLKFIKNEAGSKAVGTILGLFRGFGHATGRISWGALELFAFWSANPADNEGVGIPFDAQYSWQMGEQYNIFEPSLAEGVKPMGRKLVHGAVNSIAAIVEVPAQTVKGARDGNAVAGLGKGFWFWWSRQWYGFTNVFACFAPNPADNPGYPFSGLWPWSSLTEA